MADPSLAPRYAPVMASNLLIVLSLSSPSLSGLGQTEAITLQPEIMVRLEDSSLVASYAESDLQVEVPSQ
jgi:hypothetical protein